MLYFPIACKILNVCNPRRAVQQLSVNMGVNMALPCRISVYRDGGKTKLGMIRPNAPFALFPGSVDLKAVAEKVEREATRMMDKGR
jgi:uncharacterized protein (DUF302 family)